MVVKGSVVLPLRASHVNKAHDFFCPLLAYVLECSIYLSQDREEKGLQIF